MQGDSPDGRRSALRFVSLLVLSHAAAATFMVAAVFQIGRLFADRLSTSVSVIVCCVVAALAVAVDLRALRRRSYSVGLARQTSKALNQKPDLPSWVAPVFWGLDTGLIWTTFRVTTASWVMFTAALLNVVPQWTGLVYGLSFTIPLAVAVLNPRGADKHAIPVTGRGVRHVQLLTAALLAALPVSALVTGGLGH